MSSLDAKLAALSRRLKILYQYQPDQEDSVEQTEPTNSKYICTECAWTTSINAGALARHFTSKHASPRFKCSDCRLIYQSIEELEKHRSQKHRHLCPSCQRIFATVDRCKHHEPCEGQYQNALKTIEDTASQTPIDQTFGGKAPASTLDKSNSVPFGYCPDPECQLPFDTFDTLYEHYVGSHPASSIITHGHPKPFKCPFCPKRYQHDRFMPAHVRTHKPKSLNVPGVGDAKDQEALIRQSRVAMANREAESRAEALAQPNHISSEEEIFQIPIMQGEEPEVNWSVALTDGVVYIDGDIMSGSQTAEQKDQTDMQQPRPIGKAIPVGLIVQASSTNLPSLERRSLENNLCGLSAEPKVSDLMDLDDNYPERFALDDDELPSRMRNLDPSINTAQHHSQLFHQTLSHDIIYALQMQHFVDAIEVVELFTYFLDEYQRLYILEQLGSISVDQHDSTILEELNRTVFKDLIDAWVSFKRLAIHTAPQLIRQANMAKIGVGKAILWALLQYCLNLENQIYRNENNVAHQLLRYPPVNTNSILPTPDAPFSYLVAALAERVKTRTAHDPSTIFTNEMIFRGMRDYVKILQTVFRQLYPIAAGHDELWRELRLL